MQRTPVEELESMLKEVRDHHEAAPERIGAYYDDPETSDFDIGPHEQIFQQAAQYFELGLMDVGVPDHFRGIELAEEYQFVDFEERSLDWEQRRDWVKQQGEDILYGIALELIVSGSHLKIDTDSYVSHLKKHVQTPHINESRACLFEDLLADLPGEKAVQIDLALDLAREKRNNLVHFGFHYQGSHNYTELFVKVGGFLIDRYGDADFPSYETLEAYLRWRERRRPASESYPNIDVDFR